MAESHSTISLTDAGSDQPSGLRMKFTRSKVWYLRMAKLEAECDRDISAGKPIFYASETVSVSTPTKPKRAGKPKVSATSSTTCPEPTAMKLQRPKEWYLRMAELEEGCDISAGKPIFYPPEALDLSTPAKPSRKPKTRATSSARTTATKRRTTTAKSRG